MTSPTPAPERGGEALFEAGWIRCDERMPDDATLVLTCDEDDESSLMVRYYLEDDEAASPWQPAPRAEIEFQYGEVITHWRKLPEMPGEDRRAEAPAPQPAREIDWEAKFREAQDADQASGLEAEEYREVLEDIRQTLCDAACPTQWVTAEGRPHCDACKKVTAILASYPGWERGPSPTPVSVEEASRVDRRLLDVPFDAPVRAPNPASEAGAAGEDELRRITGALKAKFPALTSDFLYDIARAAIRAGAEVHANTKPDFLHEGQDVKEKLDELQRRAEQAEAERDQARAEVAILRRVRQAAIDVVSAKDWMCYEPIEARRKRDDALRDAIHGIQRDEAGRLAGERLNTAEGEARIDP